MSHYRLLTIDEIILRCNALCIFLSGGPKDVSLSIRPATVLPNGTLVALRGSNVSFNCSGSSFPSQWLTWAFTGASSSNSSLVSTFGSWLDYRIEDIQPSAQGVYSCRARNTISDQAVNKSTQLLVYCKYHELNTTLCLYCYLQHFK